MRNKKSLNALQNICNYMGGPPVTKNMQMIEIGCFVGESTEVWCKNFGRVIAIDPWDLLKKDYDKKDIASKYQNAYSQRIEQEFNFRLYKYTNLQKLKAFSYQVHNLIENNSVDFIYIDGEHTYKGVKRDIQYYLPKIKKNGYIGGHDYKPKWQGVIDAVNELQKPTHIFSDYSWIIPKARISEDPIENFKILTKIP